MKVEDLRNSDTLRPLHVVMIGLVCATVAGGSLLLAASQSRLPVDGAIEWQADSPLRAVVQLLCLNYQFPTENPGEVKKCLLGVSAGLVALALCIALWVRSSEGEIIADEAGEGRKAERVGEPPSLRSAWRVHLTPVTGAQVFVLLYLIWSFASSRWSAAPDLALGASLLLTIHFLWSLGLGHGLSRRAARIACRILIGITFVTAAVALWYYYGRNPHLRAKFPFGNPTFLAACLIPGILLATSGAGAAMRAFAQERRARGLGVVFMAFLAMGISLWAFVLTGSRGATLGLLVGLAALAFFALRGRWKALPVLLLAVLLAGAGSYYVSHREGASPYGRNATIRFRQYTWSYAWRMFRDKPLTGYGQGGFVLAGDSYAVDDVLDDPLVFEARIAHAHNEWLEVMADLGGVGIVLLAAALILTLQAAMKALRHAPRYASNWALMGLWSGLVALIVEESFSVGLRVSAVPIWFYTVMGLIWALSSVESRSLVSWGCRTSRRRILCGAAGGTMGLAALVLSQQDFAAARNAYEAEQELTAQHDQAAVRLAEGGLSRLNPQRALTGLFLLGKTHVRIARRLLQRAIDRETRAHQGDFVDQRLLMMAQQDRGEAESRCRLASRAIKELVARSPGFFHQGQIEYEIHLIRANNAEARGDQTRYQLAQRSAAAALERELARQPFDPRVAIDYLTVASGSVDLKKAITLLARTLRHHRVTSAYLDMLDRLAEAPPFDAQMDQWEQAARRALDSSAPTSDKNDSFERWAPELLRLAAARHFVRGDYESALQDLTFSARRYTTLAFSAPDGAAACFAELADCRFFHDPNAPKSAVESALRAVSLAPKSFSGRQFTAQVKQRLVDYYLAADQEEKAVSLMKETAPPDVTPDMVRAELATRYRRLCESLLRRREAQVLRKPANEIFPKLRRWTDRALTLNPDDASAHFLAADLAFHGGEDEAAAEHLRRALDLGLSPASAAQFLDVALDKNPNSKPLQSLRNELTLLPSSQPSSPAPEPVRNQPHPAPTPPPAPHH